MATCPSCGSRLSKTMEDKPAECNVCGWWDGAIQCSECGEWYTESEYSREGSVCCDTCYEKQQAKLNERTPDATVTIRLNIEIKRKLSDSVYLYLADSLNHEQEIGTFDPELKSLMSKVRQWLDTLQVGNIEIESELGVTYIK